MKLIIAVILFFCLSLVGFGQAAHYHIEKIEFHSTPGDFEGCEFGFVIMPNGVVTYKADSVYCKPIIAKKQSIRKHQYDSLVQMLDDIKFPELKDKYGYGIDMERELITITYNNGKKKRISVVNDEPEELKKIMHLLYKVKETEHWK